MKMIDLGKLSTTGDEAGCSLKQFNREAFLQKVTLTGLTHFFLAAHRTAFILGARRVFCIIEKKHDLFRQTAQAKSKTFNALTFHCALGHWVAKVGYQVRKLVVDEPPPDAHPRPLRHRRLAHFRSSVCVVGHQLVRQETHVIIERRRVECHAGVQFTHALE